MVYRELNIFEQECKDYSMQKKCSKCGKPIKKVGRLIRVTWLGFRAPLCKNCREELKKGKKSRFGRLLIWKR
jgi:predicted amidophosphoribosyltransferase